MKISKFFLYALLAGGLSMTTVACGDDDENNNDPFQPENPNKPDDGNDNNVVGDLSITEQKESLETTGINLMRALDADNFNGIERTFTYINDSYVNNPAFNTSEVEQWFKTCVDALEVTDQNGKPVRSRINENVYKQTILLSKFYGHFNATEQGWVKEEGKANDLRFTFNDQNGNKCEVSLTHSGKEKTIFFEEDYDGHYVPDAGWIEELYETYISIPENIQAKMIQNGKELIVLDLHNELEVVTDEFDYTKDNLAFTSKVKVNDYLWEVSQGIYNAQKGASVRTKLTKGNELLVEAEAQYNGKIRDNEAETDVHEVAVNFNFMNQVQIKGGIDEWNSFYNCIEKADENYENEKEVKAWIEKGNKHVDLGLFFNTKNKQADVKLIAEMDEWGYGENLYREWFVTPAIFFNDGTSYETFEEFFNENDFEELLKDFDKFIMGFEGLY